MPQLTDHEQDIVGWGDKQLELSIQYEIERKRHGTAKAQLDILLAKKILDYADKKKNIGYDMALLFLMAQSDEAKVLYKKMVEADDNYKGLEKLLDAYKTKIMSTQSIMKYNLQGEMK